MSFKEHPPLAEKSFALHVPVLLDATLDNLSPKEGDSYLDLTAGYGGHARAVLNLTKNLKESYLVDRDSFAISKLQDLKDSGVNILHRDFLSAAEFLVEQEIKFDLILADLGVSSPQLDRAERGFSFKKNGPLDMRMNRDQDKTAADLVNKLPASELLRIITTYGEEPRGSANRIVKAIIDNRPFTETGQLAEVILKTHKGKYQKTHPATRTFQALRIAVNDELLQIENLLPLLPKLLNKGGRVGIISFHSLEDRLVKKYFKQQFDSGFEADLAPITKKPIDGSIEDVHNPRSRSAKLRVAVKK